MSRITLPSKDEDKSIAFGLDRAMGWFFQLWGPDLEDGEENLLIDKDSMFDQKFGQSSLIRLLKEWGLPSEKLDKYTAFIAMDLDPELVDKRSF